MIVALCVAALLATAGFALADGASDNVAGVQGKVTPKKLLKKKFKPVNLFLGVTNSKEQITGAQSNPKSELISISKNVKVTLGARPRCTAPLPNGITTEQAKAACPGKSFLGSGVAEVTAPPVAPVCGGDPGGSPCVIANPVVSVFNGPGINQLRLHTYHENLGPASPIVNGKIVRSPVAGYRHALRVAEAPETGAVMITKFNAKLARSTKVVKARCKPRKFKFQRTVTYADASSETVTKTQRCKVKRRR